MTTPTVEEILDGIDKDECEYHKGWWETSYGAEFGARKKKELLEAFDARFEEGVRAERERVREYVLLKRRQTLDEECMMNAELFIRFLDNK